ncbi:mitochondrial potassium channel ATP-binding subunit-like isoform X2 [Liolophura sinensis]|uniref:mitochondrial potassium channel ATP-binding subunit-like isoform X2 n=1 Tax=Liolophura sinensis TaxID=3198878 RepID=UPI003158D7CA
MPYLGSCLLTSRFANLSWRCLRDGKPQVKHLRQFSQLRHNLLKLGQNFKCFSSLSRTSAKHGIFERIPFLNSLSKFQPTHIGLGTGFVGYWAIRHANRRGVIVECKAKRTPSRLLDDLEEKEEPPFCWREFFKLLLPDIWYLIAAIISALGVALVNVRIPLLLGDVVNVVSKFTVETATSFMDDIKIPALHLIAYYGIQGALTFSYISFLSVLGERLATRLRTQLFQALIRQDVEFFDDNKTGELIDRLTSDVQDFKSSLKLCISQGLRAITQTVGCVVSLLLISPKLTLVMGLVVPGVIGVGTLLGSGLRALSRSSQTQVAKSTAVADEAIGNVRTVRAFAMEEKEIELYEREVQEACRLNIKLGVGIGIFQGLTNIALNGIVLGVLFAGGNLMSTHELTPGDLMSFMVATQTIERSLAQLSLLFGHAVRGLSAGSRVFELTTLKPKLNLTGGEKIPFHSMCGKIEFRNVRFSYPTRKEQEVLQGFSLEVKGGQVVALVGLSGGGKSTVAALLERFYDIDHGEITVDGKDIRTLDPTWLRGKAIGFINQEPVLFATSVMENIRYGRPDATDQEVVEAARLANAHQFITNFPEGYSTVLGERGVTVSGGQKQRIAIARALIKNPAILILDEATSALDAESERIVQEALDRVIQGRTVLIIAHRLSTIRDADAIAVVAKGKIVEMGSHEDLRRKKGYYWELMQKQHVEEELEQV